MNPRLPFACVFLLASALGNAAEVSREAWISGFEAAIPVAFCANETPFRACFSVTAQQCEQTVASATRVCIAKIKDKIPAMVQQPQQGTALGTEAGRCVGNSYFAIYANKAVSSAQCAAAMGRMTGAPSAGK